MDTVIPPQFRDLGAAATVLEWDVSALADGPIVDGAVDAAFGDLTGSEALDIDVGAGLVTVTFAGTEADATDTAATINGTGSFSTAGPGGTPLASVITAGGSERLRLQSGSTYLEVGNHSSRAAFERTGLPEVARDASSPATNFTVPVETSLDRFDLISSALVVPAGANYVDLLCSLTGVDAADGEAARIVYLVVFEYATGEGDPSAATELFQLPIERLWDTGGAIDIATAGDLVVPEAPFVRASHYIGTGGSLQRWPVRVPVFGGVSKVRVIPAVTLPPEPGDITDLPTAPPVFSAIARAVAR